ncbi:tRNA (cytosine(72)-C(5))-methyltransferase NSUN6 [Chelonus insularis]|uniref:tRNA (cytosine(72)-C(5))-methyltransferase NSUN6 n=1 Tax=Chelonus insularis TaxID=460826 RepID=UPI00158AB3A8|nr:tRNA (cytosine(72)-C(5))-methyltransferase NSUN6 [Chelonus insularis]
MNNEQSFFRHKEAIEAELKNDLSKIRVSNHYLNDIDIKMKLDKLLKWLRETPKITTIRVNTLLSNPDAVISHLKNKIECLPKISTYPSLPELIVVANREDLAKDKLSNTSEQLHQIIVDESCGAAVLRGSHIFAPGVMGLTSGAKVGDKVEVFADVYGRCKKGFAKKYENNEKVFLGYGILQKSRNEIFFEDNKCKGIAVLMNETTSGLPQLGNESLLEGSGLLQNLPSIICSRILDPQPGEIVLDMCAAPGNKTTHLSALMKNEGIIIAMDKIKSKITKLQNNCDTFGCKNIKIFCYDATKAADLEKNSSTNLMDGPPFQKETFKRILLDGPCSVLGKRPQLFNKISLNELRSFTSLQRKLFAAAIELLEPGGFLVYSTCTITISENEGIVAWALKKYPGLQLISARKKLNSLGLDCFPISQGYCIDDLPEEKASCLLRFGLESDTVGFFISLFTKKHP